jgi:integrase
VTVGKLSAGVCRKYELVWEKFVELSGIDIKQRATSINPGIVRRFCEWLDENYENSSSCGMQQKLKSILLFGRENGYLNTLPFQEKIIKVEKMIEIPSEADFVKIVTTPLGNKSLEKVRDLWVFASGSGLAYCDCVLLSKEDFGEDNGTYFIKKRRRKTGVEFFSVLLPWAVDIAKKYNFEIPVISNQKVNTYLKTIGDISGVKVPLHFHLARHFYACSLLNNYNLSTDIVAKCLGHSKPGKITSHYAKLFDQTVINAFTNKNQGRGL